MTEVLANHPLKITVSSVIITSIALVTFGWKTSAAVTEININQKLEQQYRKEMRASIEANSKDITVIKTTLSNWGLDDKDNTQKQKNR